MYTRREWLKLTAAAGTALAIHPRLLQAQDAPMITRAVPSTGEELPIIGLGSSATFSSVARSDDVTALRNVLTALLDNGGSLFDTAPSYGASEEVAGAIINEIDARDRVFWATKLNVAGRGGGAADPERAWEQIETSFERIQKTPIDLIQVHNLGDPPTQLGILNELKAEGRIRYTGITCTQQRRYGEFEQVMSDQPLDFIGVDYAVDTAWPRKRSCPWRRTAASACWSTRRSAVPGCGTASRAATCPNGQRSSAPSPGPSSSSSTSRPIRQ